MGSLALRSGDLLTILKMALSIGYRSSVVGIEIGRASFRWWVCLPLSTPAFAGRAETKYLRLCTAVTLGCRFGDWRVCWRGGWSRHRLFYLVMLVRVEPSAQGSPTRAPSGRGAQDG